MISALLNKFNTLRKEKLFNTPLYKAQQGYAFIGVGMHSLTNLYPILRHFGIRLHYICTKNSSWNKEMASLFPGCHFTNNVSDILQDPAVTGVFLCTKAEAHFGLLTQLLNSGKPVFVEKPPCYSLEQLEQLTKLNPQGICKVGLQRRYWPANKHLVKKVPKVKSYIYRFHFGSYLQGDPFTELFIHALDYCDHLFGNYTLQSFSKNKDNNGLTVQLHVRHQGNISGLIELSTHFSWNAPTDILEINSSDEALTVQYPILVEGLQKPKRIMNIPTERLLQQPIVRKTYFTTGNLLTPVAELNTLVLQGFYHEMEAFIQLTEGMPNANKLVKNDLPGLKPIFNIIEEIRK
jgi:virulence factor